MNCVRCSPFSIGFGLTDPTTVPALNREVWCGALLSPFDCIGLSDPTTDAARALIARAVRCCA